MKKITLTIILCACTFISKAQETNVEKSIYGAQIGVLGFYGYNESRLSNTIALRTELGLDGGVYISKSFGNDFIFTPVITLEPRWYYNLEKRASKSKSIRRNSGNFLSLKVSYHPDLFVISSRRNTFVPNQISIIPTWGIRRNLGKKLNFETGIGIGYRRIFNKNYIDKNEGVVNLHLRIGL